MVMFSFLILGTAFVFLGRSYVISEYRDNMVSNAEEVSHAAQALVRDGELSNWDLRMVISTLAQSTGNHIFITDTDGTIVSCSCRNIACEHLGRTVGSAQLTQLRKFTERPARGKAHHTCQICLGNAECPCRQPYRWHIAPVAFGIEPVNHLFGVSHMHRAIILTQDKLPLIKAPTVGKQLVDSFSEQ